MRLIGKRGDKEFSLFFHRWAAAVGICNRWCLKSWSDWFWLIHYWPPWSAIYYNRWYSLNQKKVGFFAVRRTASPFNRKCYFWYMLCRFHVSPRIEAKRLSRSLPSTTRVSIADLLMYFKEILTWLLTIFHLFEKVITRSFFECYYRSPWQDFLLKGLIFFRYEPAIRASFPQRKAGEVYSFSISTSPAFQTPSPCGDSPFAGGEFF